MELNHRFRLYIVRVFKYEKYWQHSGNHNFATNIKHKSRKSLRGSYDSDSTDTESIIFLITYISTLYTTPAIIYLFLSLFFFFFVKILFLYLSLRHYSFSFLFNNFVLKSLLSENRYHIPLFPFYLLFLFFLLFQLALLPFWIRVFISSHILLRLEPKTLIAPISSTSRYPPFPANPTPILAVDSLVFEK